MHPRARTRACDRTRTHLAGEARSLRTHAFFLSGRARVKCARRVIAQLFPPSMVATISSSSGVKDGKRTREREGETTMPSICESTQSVLLPSVDRSNGRLARSFFSLFPLRTRLPAAEQGRKWRIRANGNDKRQREHGRGEVGPERWREIAGRSHQTDGKSILTSRS